MFCMKTTVSIYLENKTFIIISVHTVCQNQRFVNMFWSEMMARMNQQPKIVKDWVCSRCDRGFEKRENLICHVNQKRLIFPSS